MTGAYLRAKRNGEWMAVEVEHLTDKEREEILKDDDRLLKWLNLVCNSLVEAEELFKELENAGILKKGKKGE